MPRCASLVTSALLFPKVSCPPRLPPKCGPIMPRSTPAGTAMPQHLKRPPEIVV